MSDGDLAPGGREILVQLLDATPLPTPGCDIEPLLAALDGILAARAAILALIVPPLVVADADLPLVAELERAAALGTLGRLGCGAGGLRAYAPTI